MRKSATTRSHILHAAIVVGLLGQLAIANNSDWPTFRGADGRGVATGFATRTSWTADEAKSDGILWRTEVPGLGHSSPVITGDRLFVATAVASSGEAPIKVGRSGAPTAADDNGEQQWVILCLNKKTGKENWRRVAKTGIPQATRHAKATHANTSICIGEDRLLAFFGSEGLYCYDFDGRLLWSRDLGVINISKYGVGWGYASSPAIWKNRIALVCDDPSNPYAAVLDLDTGDELWRVARNEECERNWSTPLIHQVSASGQVQVIVNGWPWITSYDIETGEEVWRLRGGGDNPVPTPFVDEGLVYITSAHGNESPIFAIRPTANGDISSMRYASEANEHFLWSVKKGGSYMSTPVIANDLMFLGNSNGIVRCFHARTGEFVFEKRLGTGAGIISSLVAADGKIYCPSENGKVYVLAAKPEFELLATNELDAPCLASPAISEGRLYFRTLNELIAIDQPN